MTPGLLSDLAVGALFGEGVGAFFEFGYHAVWVQRPPLAASVDALDLQREPYGWNALRAAAGVTLPL